MKKRWKTTAHLILLVSTLLPASAALSQSYLGEACWLVQPDDQSPGDTNYLKLAFLDIGNGHLTVNGYSISIEFGSPDEINPMNGNAEIFGDQIRVTLNSTASDEDDAAVAAYHVKISAENLAGSYEGFGTFIDKQTETTSPFVISGTVTLSDCPDIWIPQGS